MPEIEIEINAETGEMETKINGIAGSACREPPKPLRKSSGNPQKMKKRVNTIFRRRLNDKSKENSLTESNL